MIEEIKKFWNGLPKWAKIAVPLAFAGAVGFLIYMKMKRKPGRRR